MKRGRFAPTPSGFMHIGNAWTALLSWLQMRSAEGEFVLRIEDIDAVRSRQAYIDAIIEDLYWLGLDWDEGPDIGGPHAPYVQSKRMGLYEDAMNTLIRNGHVYPCYCSRAELANIASAPHGQASEGAAYPGICRHLTDRQKAEKAGKKTPSFRFALPDRPVAFADLAAGNQRFPASAGGDFVVKRADGMIGYQLAVTVDDAHMQITDVVRGMDLLDSTPRQILLYEALGLRPPRFAHIPLIINKDGSRLSKRDSSLMLRTLRENGVRPQKIIGLFAYLCGMIDRVEAVQASELVERFTLANLSVEAIVLNSKLLAP